MDSLHNSWKAASSLRVRRIASGAKPCLDHDVSWQNNLVLSLVLLAILGLMFWSVTPSGHSGL